jgi:hypothetical protein
MSTNSAGSLGVFAEWVPCRAENGGVSGEKLKISDECLKIRPAAQVFLPNGHRVAPKVTSL